MNEWEVLTVVSFASLVADIELTQACLRARTCREGNPLVPTRRGRVYALQLSTHTAIAYLGWRLRKGGARWWWFPQASITAAHGVGIGFGLRFQF